MRRLTAGIDIAAAVAALIGRPLGPAEAIAVAVSGGPDSLALLLLAHAAFGARVRALSVDHALRAEAAAEAAQVAALCGARGIPHATLVWRGPRPAASLQAAARAARYALLRDWCAAHHVAWLATAHHADDQAETLLLRLARGSGEGGLAGIRARRELGGGVALVRPLLGVRRTALAAVAAGLPAVDDPANRAERFDRTRARALLAATPWLDPARLAAVAAHHAQAETALDWTAALAWDGRAIVAAGRVTLDVAGLPAELVRRLVRRALAELVPEAVPRGPELARFTAALAAARSATLAGVAARGGPIWTFRRAPPRRILPES